jgi:hypothetical protein
MYENDLYQKQRLARLNYLVQLELGRKQSVFFQPKTVLAAVIHPVLSTDSAT